MDDLLQEFLAETNENLVVVDNELIQLEQDPTNPDLIGSIFRMVHTIKGTCGFIGLSRLEKVAHAGENVLGKLRDKELTPEPAIISVVLEAFDRIKEILQVLESEGTEPEGDDSALIAKLHAAEKGDIAALGGNGDAAPAPAAAPAETSDPNIDLDNLPEHASLDELEAFFQAAPGPESAAPAPEQAVAEKPAAEKPKANPPAPKTEGNPPATTPKEGGAAASQLVRVSVDLLEDLMTMVSELVLTRNQLLQIARHQQDSSMNTPLQRLSHITTELQEGVMKTRMQPIGNAWSKLPRIIRDLGMELGKKIDLVMHGEETELDRQVLELIRDPLTHMVRNSADHGIEKPEERIAAGKPETGTVNLSAHHEGGHIIIDITDDGKGLDVERIKEKALANGITSEAELAAMSDSQIFQFIFKAGFSTAQQVTSVSGRGVGMDVVRTNIEKIGGAIEIQSKKGEGSSFIIKIPLTLAIVSGLIVESNGERFAIPQINISELVRVNNRSEHKIEYINGAPVLRLRNRLLSLVSLRKVLGLPERELEEKQSHYIAVIQVGAISFGLIVDRVYDTEEIVVKPVSPLLKNLSIFSGNTILGDGSVIMILDPNGIATHIGNTTGLERIEEELTNNKINDDIISLLLFRTGDKEKKAVALASITRLEEIETAKLEKVDENWVVQYRGHLMPLIPIDEKIDMEGPDHHNVLVLSEQEQHLGVVVSEIIDIVDEAIEIDISGSRPGIMGSTILRGQATEIIQPDYFWQKVFGRTNVVTSEMGQSSSNNGGCHVLLVDDSAFFRNFLTPQLVMAGFQVEAAASALDALKILEKREYGFDAIISDIDMPEMNGFEFAQTLRSNDNYKMIPLIALSGHTKPEDFTKAREVGFDDYVAKHDRDAIVESLAHSIETLQGVIA